MTHAHTAVTENEQNNLIRKIELQQNIFSFSCRTWIFSRSHGSQSNQSAELNNKNLNEVI